MPALRLIAVTLPVLVSSAHAQVVFEDFEQAGSSMLDSYFSDLWVEGDGLFRRVVPSMAEGAPKTSPTLPIGVGGSKVARYSEVVLAPDGGRALGPDRYSGTRIEGFIGFGNVGDDSLFAHGGFQLRSSFGDDPDTTGYVASLYPEGVDHLKLAITYRCQGLIHSSYAMVLSDPFAADFATENYYLSFTAEGTRLSASVDRVHVAGGVVVQEPIDLSSQPGLQSRIELVDERLSAGYPALEAFGRVGDSIYFEDVRVTDLGRGPGDAFCFGDGSTLPCPCGNDSIAGEGCTHSQGRGAWLEAVGTASVAADDLILMANQLPANTMGLIFAGDAVVGLPFGAGLRCTGGPLTRFPADATTRCAYLSVDHVATKLGVVPGDTRTFQAWFRDPQGPCGATYNTSAALAVTFTP